MEQIFGDKKAIAIFVLPALLFFIVFGFIPILQSFYYSLLSWDGIQQSNFVWFANYKDIFFVDTYGMTFVRAVLNSLLLALMSVLFQLPIALVLALILAGGVRGEKIYRTIYFVPVVISSAAVGLLFLRIYNPDFGMLNIFFDNLGLGAFRRDWLSNENTALLSVFIPVIWQYIGYHMLLMYAAIKGIPDELYEAAEIDGASNARVALTITIPLIRSILGVCLIFAVIGSLKFFDLVYVMTGGAPSPVTDVPSTLMYTTIFTRRLYGYGSSMAFFLVLECLAFYLILQHVLKLNTEKD